MSAPSFTAAAVQFEPTLGARQQNVERLLSLCRDAARDGAKLIATPEMATTGYCWYDRAEVASLVETIPGPTTEAFHELARRHDCYIVVGMPEVDAVTNLYYNSAVLIGPEGVVGVHRKTHPYISEPKWAAAGDLGHRVFETRIGRIAMLICMDIHFVETARLAALGGADVIVHISNWLAERAPAPYWINRAMENGCYVLESNRWGWERTVQFSGGSCLIEPDGSVAAVVDHGDGYCLGTIDCARSRKRSVLGEPDILAQRRPSLYIGLMQDSFLWNPADFFGLYGHRPLPAGRKSAIASVQFRPDDDVEANLRRIEALACQAGQRGAELAVFPELAMCGTADPAARAQSLDGLAVRQLVCMAIGLNMHLAVGMALREGDALFNAMVVAGPEGLAGVYRKIHLTGADRAWASAGDRWTVLDLPVGRVGLLIGHDAAFPESGRVLALQGCDVIACGADIAQTFVGAHGGTSVPQNHPIPTGADPLHWHLFRCRAGENNVYLAFANTQGHSGVFGPDSFQFPRHERLLFEQEGLAVLAIDTRSAPESRYPTNVVRRKDLVAMRLPHHYSPLVALSRTR